MQQQVAFVYREWMIVLHIWKYVSSRPCGVFIHILKALHRMPYYVSLKRFCWENLGKVVLIKTFSWKFYYKENAILKWFWRSYGKPKGNNESNQNFTALHLEMIYQIWRTHDTQYADYVWHILCRCISQLMYVDGWEIAFGLRLKLSLWTN